MTTTGALLPLLRRGDTPAALRSPAQTRFRVVLARRTHPQPFALFLGPERHVNEHAGEPSRADPLSPVGLPPRASASPTVTLGGLRVLCQNSLTFFPLRSQPGGLSLASPGEALPRELNSGDPAPPPRSH
jgi:hypothetical protein